MARDSASFCVATCCRSAALTLAVGLAGLWAATAVGGQTAQADLSDGPLSLVSLRRPRVVVLKANRRLHLLDGGTVVRTYPIGLGPHPVGDKQQAGDGRTPEGVFHICTKKLDSEHHRFLGIDYPDPEAARRGLAVGLLTDGEARAIMAAAAEGRCPPWLTAIGGGVGLHGRGRAGASGDWTAGCIALADRDIEELFAVLRIGDEVEILP